RPARGLRAGQPESRRTRRAHRPGGITAAHVPPPAGADPGGGQGLTRPGHPDRAPETWLNEANITVVRPAYRTDPPRPGRTLLRAVRQSVESVNDTLKDHLNLEQHGGRTPPGGATRVLPAL